MSIAIGVGVIALLFFSCKSVKRVSYDEKIIFGSYGGFAGSYDEFTLYGSGSVEYKQSIKSKPNVIKSIDRKTAKQLFRSIHDLNIRDMDIHDPGNMTYFLRFSYKGKEHELKWGGSETVPSSLKDYFSLLRKLTKDRNPIM